MIKLHVIIAKLTLSSTFNYVYDKIYWITRYHKY